MPRGKGSGIHIHKPGVYNNAAAMPVIPGKWSAEPPHAVVGDLRESRRKERIPHSSFDIDGDGIVSQLDYFYATQFDKDRDGKLNSEVRVCVGGDPEWCSWACWALRDCEYAQYLCIGV